MLKKLSMIVSVAGIVFACVSGAQAVVIDTVPVGNPGNAGELSGAGGAGGTGPDRICGAVDYTYDIGKYEVTAGQYTEFLNKVAGVDAYGLYNENMWTDTFGGCKIERYAGAGTTGDPYQYRVAANYANRPVDYVSWGDSARFANWLHNGQPAGAQDLTTTEDGAYLLDGATTDPTLLAVNRETDWLWAIPTEDEWYKAAYHKNDGATGNYFDYPTSSDSVPSNDLVDPDPGNNATFLIGGTDYTIGSPYWRTEVGAHENSESPYDTFDQGGNLWEWDEALIVIDSTTKRGTRGGSYRSSGDADRMLAAQRTATPPTTEARSIGLRVAEVPEPATLVMLALGGLGILRRKKT